MVVAFFVCIILIKGFRDIVRVPKEQRSAFKFQRPAPKEYPPTIKATTINTVSPRLLQRLPL